MYDDEIAALNEQVNALAAENEELEKKRFQVAGDIIESVRGSLRGYPDCGGDIEIMREVERIVNEATAELQKDKVLALSRYECLRNIASRFLPPIAWRMFDAAMSQTAKEQGE